MSDLPKGAIAVIGMACRFPGARCVDDFWRNLRDGIESIIPLSDEVLRSAGVKLEEFERPNYVKARSSVCSSKSPGRRWNTRDTIPSVSKVQLASLPDAACKRTLRKIYCRTDI